MTRIFGVRNDEVRRAWRVNHIAGPIMQATQEAPIMGDSAIPPTPVPPAQPVPGNENDDLPF